MEKRLIPVISANMIKDSKYTDNKELLIIPNASHTDLYDEGMKYQGNQITIYYDENT